MSDNKGGLVIGEVK